MTDFEKLSLQLKSLVIFSDVSEDTCIKKLIELISYDFNNDSQAIEKYSRFVSLLFKNDENLTEYIWKKVLEDENIYLLNKIEGKTVSKTLEDCLKNELTILQGLSAVKSQEITDRLPRDIFLPKWETSEIDFFAEYEKRMSSLSTIGYGIFAKHIMFSYADGKLIPVKSPDGVRLSHLSGYERSRNRVIDNTKTLLKGLPAANVLLYGDAGTGKSSTVKAIVNEYGNQGLRLIEVKKTQLLEISQLAESLSGSPLKFILFIDDLSFAGNNEEIGALKAMLEGSVAARTQNIVIYATSNRRHLVKETFSDRGNDDIHINETIQEQTSLSERFGLSVGFFKPDKDQYLQIVFDLAKQYDLKNTENLELLAERHAIERGGRSGRCARQFIEYLKGMEE